MSEQRPQMLDYRTPPPVVRRRRAWVAGWAFAWAGSLLLILSVARMGLESAHRSVLKDQDLREWFDAELVRRFWEADRRAGKSVGPMPPVPTPTTIPAPALTSLQVLHGADAAWAIAFLFVIHYCRTRPAVTDVLIHRCAVAKLSLSVATIGVMLFAYQRLRTGDPFELVMLVFEAAIIAGAITLLTYHRAEADVEPVPVSDAQASP